MPHTADLDRVRRFSRAMAKVTTAGIVLIALLMVLVFLIPDWTRNFLLAKLGQAGADLPLRPDSVAAGAAVTAVPVGIMLYGLWQVRALFCEFGWGRVFTTSSALRLRNFAAAMLAQAVVGPLSSTALLLAFTWSNPPFDRHIGIAFSTDDLLALILGGVILAVAWAMVEAARIADEHASFV
jgi:hypothetical protein